MAEFFYVEKIEETKDIHVYFQQKEDYALLRTQFPPDIGLSVTNDGFSEYKKRIIAPSGLICYYYWDQAAKARDFESEAKDGKVIKCGLDLVKHHVLMLWHEERAGEMSSIVLTKQLYRGGMPEIGKLSGRGLKDIGFITYAYGVDIPPVTFELHPEAKIQWRGPQPLSVTNPSPGVHAVQLMMQTRYEFMIVDPRYPAQELVNEGFTDLLVGERKKK